MTAAFPATHRPWKPSVFNVIHREAGRYYYFNSVSTAVFSLDPAQHEFARNCLAEIEAKGRCSSAAIEELLAQGSFLVPRYHDEYEDEHQRFLEVKRREDWAFLSIAPTFSCNLRCDYCFQAGRQGPRVLMDPKVAQCLAALFEELAERVQGLAVLWFGGEPLLALSRIEQLTRIFRRTCEKRGVRYRAEMMTNGSLLNEHTLLRLRDLSLHKLEISIDGLPESYSRRKGLPLRQALGFYEFLVRNADRVLDAVKSLVVRINVDRQNLAEAREIVGRMRHQCEAAGRIDFRLQFLGEGRGAECLLCAVRDSRRAGGVRAIPGGGRPRAPRRDPPPGASLHGRSQVCLHGRSGRRDRPLRSRHRPGGGGRTRPLCRWPREHARSIDRHGDALRLLRPFCERAL